VDGFFAARPNYLGVVLGSVATATPAPFNRRVAWARVAAVSNPKSEGHLINLLIAESRTVFTRAPDCCA
jgi:hypothetical protein